MDESASRNSSLLPNLSSRNKKPEMVGSEEDDFIRSGNFTLELRVRGAFIVHRGVSQGGRELRAWERRFNFWQKNCQKVDGITINDGKVIVTLPALRILRERNLVIVSNPGKPRVWTVRRILEFAERVQALPEAVTGESRRRGGMKL